MKQTTLCYIKHNNKTLMLHRTKKENDENHDKWIGVGGKLEPGETPEECLLREVQEETGLTLKSFSYKGVVTFVSDEWEAQHMHLFTADGFSGELLECDEGVLEWIDDDMIDGLNLWEGDREIFRLMNENHRFFSLKLVYEKDRLCDSKVWVY